MTEEIELVPDPQQMDAEYLLLNERVGIITGPGGSGKTSVVRRALQQYGQRSVALVAPTGKAARRLAEVTEHPAGTIHKLLGLRPGERNSWNFAGELSHEVVIVDESSMLDTEVMAALMQAVRRSGRTSVFFIGDVNQLPSVGPGQVLADMIDSGVIPVVRLQTVHRAAQESWVFRTAPKVLDGQFDFGPAGDFKMVEVSRPGMYIQACCEEVCVLSEEYGKDNVQLIVPMNVGDYGANILNPEIQEAMNPDPGDAETFSTWISKGVSHKVRAGDRVVARQNDYDRLVFNGETGTVLSVEGRGEGAVRVDFYDRVVEYSKSRAGDNLRLSYALTVHRSQGSQYHHVIVALHSAHEAMLNRRLLYTAITRAQKTVTIVGQRSAVKTAISVREDTLRSTTLKQRLIDRLRAVEGGSGGSTEGNR